MVDTKGLDQADVLIALYNRAKPQGMGFLQYDNSPMEREEALEWLDKAKAGDHYFDYLKGRVMKVRLANPDEFDERLYDRDNGPGAARDAIGSLRNKLCCKEA